MFGFTITKPLAGVPNASEEKSPLRIACVGTSPVPTDVTPRRWYFCSPSRQKQVLFLRIGPPIDPPNWFRWNFSLSVAKKLLASSEVLRKNSYKLPLNPL